MKRIALTQGKFALVSDCDYKYLIKQGDWYFQKQSHSDDGYAARSEGHRGHRKTIFLHNIVAARKGIVGQPDHKDQNKLNCCRGNLRPATDTQNKGNRKKYANGKSKFKGVYWNKLNRTWRAQIGFHRLHTALGSFSGIEVGEIQAAYAYNVAATKRFKKHAYLNPVDHLLGDKTKSQIKQDVLQRLETM